jgi:hypothetical protein
MDDISNLPVGKSSVSDESLVELQNIFENRMTKDEKTHDHKDKTINKIKVIVIIAITAFVLFGLNVLNPIFEHIPHCTNPFRISILKVCILVAVSSLCVYYLV